MSDILSMPTIDIVIPTIRNLDFLKHWDIFKKYRIIVIHDAYPETEGTLSIPEGFNITYYNRKHIDELLGKRSWIIPYKDSGCRCFGFLMSQADYVFTIDDDCYPAKFSNGNIIDPVEQHIKNLVSMSSPEYFNTLYDGPFVRGFPYSLRNNSKTVISHGLWLNVPDLDAPTQMQQPDLKNLRYIDMSITIPKKSLYSMCGMNLAFDRKAIGGAMYFGLNGRNLEKKNVMENWPLRRYDDMWAGWCSKVICDHLGLGVKSGMPYINHSRASSWQSNLEKEWQGLIWQDKIVDFFSKADIPSNITTLYDSYVYLANCVKALSSLNKDYFEAKSKAMETWAEIWKEFNT